MEGLLIILALLFVVGIPFCVVLLLISNANLKRRVAALEAAATPKAAAAKPWATPFEPKGGKIAVEPPPAPPTKAPVTDRPSPIEKEASTPGEEEPAPPPPATEPATAQQAYEPPAAFVLTGEKAAALGDWLKENWFFAIAGLSLALAGVFFVQYGIETGLLSPRMRVAGALVLGVLLIGAGELLRRRSSGDEASDTGVLAAILAGAGIVSVFAGLLAARQLYDLIGPELAFVALAVTGAGAVLLGWFHGPFVAAMGIVGAVASPFVVGGSSDEPYGLYGYFALILVVGLAIDAGRRWAWVSTLTLTLTTLAAWTLAFASGGQTWHLGFAVFAFAAAVIIPVWSLTPQHDGATLGDAVGRLAGRAGSWPDFPARLSALALLAACFTAVRAAGADGDGFWIALSGLGVLLAMLAIWLRPAPALSDQVVMPVAAFLGILVLPVLEPVPTFQAFRDWIPETPETPLPRTVTSLVAIAIAAALIAGWRALREVRLPVLWTLVAALIAPATVLILEFLWKPAQVLGRVDWAFHPIAAAIAMTLLAERQKGVSEHRSLRVSLYLIAAMTMISLSLFLIFAKAALSVAVAVMVLVAVLLDRRFDLPQLGTFALVGVVVAGWRAVIDPGVEWAIDAPLPQILLAYLGPIVLFGIGWVSAATRGRHRVLIMLESGLWVLGAILVSILLFRLAEALGGDDQAHTYLGLMATTWLVVAFGQLYRQKLGGGISWWVRTVIACLAGLLALGFLLLELTILSPLSSWGGPVAGPWLLNTLVPAYAVPGLVFVLGARYLRHLFWWLRAAFAAAGVGLLIVYIAFAIRHIWRGPSLDVPGVTDPELYSYTVAMMLAAAALMLAAWQRQSQVLRKIGVAVVGLTIAKVFLIDMSGLTGLIRVVSFLALGLSLAGLALVNRWITGALEEPVEDQPSD